MSSGCMSPVRVGFPLRHPRESRRQELPSDQFFEDIQYSSASKSAGYPRGELTRHVFDRNDAVCLSLHALSNDRRVQEYCTQRLIFRERGDYRRTLEHPMCPLPQRNDPPGWILHHRPCLPSLPASHADTTANTFLLPSSQSEHRTPCTDQGLVRQVSTIPAAWDAQDCASTARYSCSQCCAQVKRIDPVLGYSGMAANVNWLLPREWQILFF